MSAAHSLFGYDVFRGYSRVINVQRNAHLTGLCLKQLQAARKWVRLTKAGAQRGKTSSFRESMRRRLQDFEPCVVVWHCAPPPQNNRLQAPYFRCELKNRKIKFKSKRTSCYCKLICCLLFLGNSVQRCNSYKTKYLWFTQQMWQVKIRTVLTLLVNSRRLGK